MGQLNNYRLFQTDDIDEGQQFASQIWERNRTALTSSTYGLRWNHVRLERTDFSYVEQDGPAVLRAEGPISDHFRLYYNKRGVIEHIVNGRCFQSDTARSAVHAPGIDLQANLLPFHLMIVGFNGATVRNALRQYFRRVPPPEDWVGALAAGPRQDALHNAIDWLTAEFDRPGSPLAKPGKPRALAERTVLSLFIECLTEIAPCDSEPVLDVGETHIRRAEAWIEANLSEPVGVHEMASALGVGVRSLQLTFHRLRGCSPSEAITARRLEAARLALLRAVEGDTVTQIATGLGFYELGRFAQRYRKQFGEAPSATLARSTGLRYAVRHAQ